MENLAKLVVFLPLISGVLNGIYCKKISFKGASLLASISILTAAASATCLFFKVGVEKQHIHHVVATWISIDSLNINWAIYVVAKNKHRTKYSTLRRPLLAGGRLFMLKISPK